MEDNCINVLIRIFSKRHLIIIQGIDDTWSADLVEIPKLSEWKNGNKYLLTLNYRCI